MRRTRDKGSENSRRTELRMRSPLSTRYFRRTFSLHVHIMKCGETLPREGCLLSSMHPATDPVHKTFQMY
jgi:hypothetical protein